MRLKIAALLSGLVFTLIAQAQLSLSTAGTPFVISFDAAVSGVSAGVFDGSGFEPAATGGRLSSNAFAVTGWSDGNLAFGATRTTANTDYTRGVSTGGVSTGGMYAFDLGGTQGRSLGFQPVANDWAPGTVTLKITNNTGAAVNSIAVSYKLFVRNDQGRSNSFNFSYSADDVTYTAVSALDYASPAAADASPAFIQVTTPVTATTINLGTLLANGASFYLRWNSNDVAGSGSRDEFALDDISVTLTASGIPNCTAPAAQSAGPINFGTISTNSIAGSFPTTTADKYLVVRSTNVSLSANPADSFMYAPGDLLGGGVVVSAAAAPSFTATGLNFGTTYYFFVFAYNETSCLGGPIYRTINPLTGNATTTTPPPCGTAAAAPAALVFNSVSGNSITGSFTAASGADEYLVIRSFSSSLNGGPVDGVTYNAGDALGGGTVVSRRTNTSFTALGLNASTSYFFFIYSVKSLSCSGGPLYSTTALSGNTSTTSGGNGTPTGYYNSATGLTCAALKSSLRTIISTGYLQQTYDAVFSSFGTTDTRPAPNNNRIWDMYTDIPTGTPVYTFTFGTNQCSGSYNAEGQCYNREHSVPSSWFSDNYPMYSDQHHIFATDGFVNNRRSNFIYAKVNSASYTSSNGSKLGSSATAGIAGNVFEPINEYKGDFARAFFYMITRYESGVGFPVTSWSSSVNGGSGTNVFTGNTYPSIITPYLDMLYQWHVNDPVSQKEIDRNNAVYSIQGNRNPYVDSPQYVQKVFSCASTVVGIATVNNNPATWSSSVNTWPNPASTRVIIDIPKPAAQKIQVEVYDISGRRILHQQIPSFSRQYQLLLKPYLQNGAYFIRLSDSKESATYKVIVTD